ncbi:MAG: substrate-binding domain-containing protein [Cyanobacteria bacterium J06626_14]
MALLQSSYRRVLQHMLIGAALLVLIWATVPSVAQADSSTSPDALAPMETSDRLSDTGADELAREIDLMPSDGASTEVAEPTTVKIDGSGIMNPINQALKQQFETEFPSTEVKLDANGTEPAIQALLNEEIDLAAIGRSLTDEEKAQGLVEVPISQEQIAIIIGRKNPFDGHLTLEEFTKISQGELTDWSELGRAPGAIRFIDRPLDSDTRRVLTQYGITTATDDELGEQVVRVDTDDTAEVIRKLGTNGIGYAIASQVEGQRGVKLVKLAVLLDTLPSSKFYPYSQIRGYAYNKTSESAILPFVNFATGDTGQTAVLAAKSTEAKAIDQALNPPPPIINRLKRGIETSTTGRPAVVDPNAALDTAEKTALPWFWSLLPLSFLLLLFARWRSSTARPAPADSQSSVTIPAPTDTSNDGNAQRESTELEAVPTSSLPETPTSIPTAIPAPTGNGSVLTEADAEVPVDADAESPLVHDEAAPPLESDLPVAAPYEAATPPVKDDASTTEIISVDADDADGSSTAEVDRSERDTTADESAVDGEAEPVTAQGFCDQGWTQLNDNQYAPALTSFDRALALDADLKSAWIGRGWALFRLGRPDEAIASFDPGIEWLAHQDTSTIPGGLAFFSMAWLGRGKSKLKVGRPDDALIDINRAIELNDASADAWIGKGDCLTLLGRLDEAQACYAKSATLTGDRPLTDFSSTQERFIPPVSSPSISSPPISSPSAFDSLPTVDTAIGPATQDSPPPESTTPEVVPSVSADASPITEERPPLESVTPVVIPLVSKDAVADIPMPEIMAQRPPGEGTVAADTAMLDVVVLVDDQALLDGDHHQFTQAIEGAIANAATQRSVDTRVTWLGAHGAVDDTAANESASDYIKRTQSSFVEVDPSSPVQLIGAVAQHFDWRPGSAQSLFYISPQKAGNGKASDVGQTIEAIKSTGTIVNTYIAKSDPSEGVTSAPAYTQLAQATGGLVFTGQNGHHDIQSMVEQVVDGGCRFCVYRRLTIHSQRDCYELDQGQIDHLQTTANSTTLNPGRYIIRIKDGVFSYWTNNPHFDPEPWVLLWIYGGRFRNQQTNVEVGATWVALNGYNDTLKLDVLEPTTVCALFLDTYKDDNSGQVTLSILNTDD